MGLTTETRLEARDSLILPQTANAILPRQAHNHALPDAPLVVIEPGRTWMGLPDLWAYRELLYFLIWRDLKVRYKQTLFGVAWVVMQPLLMTLIFSVFLGLLARVPSGGVPYPLLVFGGLVPWTFLSSAIIGCTYSLIGNSNLINKVYFPRVLLPVSSVGARLVDFAFSFAILIGVMLYYRIFIHYPISPTRNLFALPFLIGLMTLFALACGMLFSALNVEYRDIGVALPVLIQLWMFVSPVIYPLSIVPPRWQPIYFLNPLAGMIQGFRAALLGGQFNRFGLAVSTLFTFVLLVISTYVFRRTEKSFADLI
jgi:lipopolysaccharide transport system permease protein